MPEIKIIERQGKEPEVVKGNTLERCFEMLIEKGILDLKRLLRRQEIIEESPKHM